MQKPRGVFLLDDEAYDIVYGPDERADIAAAVNIVAPQMTRRTLGGHLAALRGAEVIFCGWGTPLMDAAFLDGTPNLRAVFYGAGAVGSWLTEEVWRRGIKVTSAHAANSQPVAEYALAMILLSLKDALRLTRRTHAERTFPSRNHAAGCYKTSVGLISLGAIARILIDLLRPFDINVLVYDPFVTQPEAARLGVTLVDLESIFRRCDVVSLHAPDLAETKGMITGRHLSLMRPGSTFINTARGTIVREGEMIEVLAKRPDLMAILDVTDPEPPEADSPLYDLPNVLLTPHIAGSVGGECRRMGRCMVEELGRYLRGEPMLWRITPEIAERTSHRPVTVSVAQPLRAAPAQQVPVA